MKNIGTYYGVRAILVYHESKITYKCKTLTFDELHISFRLFQVADFIVVSKI